MRDKIVIEIVININNHSLQKDTLNRMMVDLIIRHIIKDHHTDLGIIIKSTQIEVMIEMIIVNLEVEMIFLNQAQVKIVVIQTRKSMCEWPTCI